MSFVRSNESLRAGDGDRQVSRQTPSLSDPLCKLHHAAFDEYFLTVDPDYRVQVQRDVLEEEDGPMLLHGLQELHGRPIVLPRRATWRPDRDLLALRLEKFAAQ